MAGRGGHSKTNSMESSSDPTLWAGAATADLTPRKSMFLFGYPRVPRMSTGVHDPLESAALYLRSGGTEILLIANDLIYVPQDIALEVRRRLHAETKIPVKAIVVTATHTHSGPVTVDSVGNAEDHVVPKADSDYLAQAVQAMVEAGCAAVKAAVKAEAGITVVQADGIGTNRHDPSGPADPEVPVLVVRAADGHRTLACMVVYAMHPTVLHEDSTLISADFPFFTRRYLRATGVVPAACPILYHNGASGNQSPRHVTRANTFTEAERLGEKLGATVADGIRSLTFSTAWPIRICGVELELLARELPTVADAQLAAKQVRARFDALRTANAPRPEIRTAECDWFGAEKTVVLASAAANGRRDAAIKRCSPAEIQLIELGAWKFVFWPGEFFVEYALEVKAASPRTFVVTLANGELQGYIVTPDAAARGIYESYNAIFSPANGRRMVDATRALLRVKA